MNPIYCRPTLGLDEIQTHASHLAEVGPASKHQVDTAKDALYELRAWQKYAQEPQEFAAAKRRLAEALTQLERYES
jgi:hypothetical protein